MAKPRKTVAAKGSGQRAAPAAVPVVSATSDSSWFRMALTIFTLFWVLGAIPAALGGEALGYWRLPSAGFQLGEPPWALSYDTPLARPAPMLANATLRITSSPGSSSVIATLEPGFAAQVTQYATRQGVRWAKVSWGGPTHSAGGSGWTLASGLIPFSANAASQARDIGDMGALSPAFGQSVSALGPGFSAALSFSNSASYHTANIDQLTPLGGQIVPLTLTALYATGIVAAQPNPSSGPPQIARDLVAGNAQALTFDYELVGDAHGMDSFLTQRHITGFQFATQQPLQAQGTTRSLALFYTALAGVQLADAHDTAEIIGLLAGANMSAATAVAPQSVIGAGALQVTTVNVSGGVVTIAAGILTPASGQSVVVVAIAHGASAAATQKTMQTYFGRLIAIIQG